MNKIYLDNAATTQPAPEVIMAMDWASEKYWGNPSSIHTFGQEAKKVVDDSRRFVAFFVGCEPEEIIFTAGGSESDNLAIRGLIAQVGSQVSGVGREAPNSKLQTPNILPHVITSAVEHHAVLHTVEDMEKQGLIEATYIKPDSEGLITPEMVEKEIRDNTILVSLIYVNNETGVVTPIREIGQLIKKINKERIAAVRGDGIPRQARDDKSGKPIFFHTDAVQAAEFFELSPEYLGVDLLSFSAHKLHGPKGIGVLYIKKGTPLKAQITGGAHEFNKRAGTENTAGIAGLHKALDLILKERSESGILSGPASLPELIDSNEAKRLAKIRDKLIQGIVDQIPHTVLNGSEFRRAPQIANISFINAEGEAIILNLDFLGIATSSGSACTSKSLEPSHVLSAMGIPPEKAHGSIRFSLSRYTTEGEIDKVLNVLPSIIKKLREMSPFK